MRKDLLGHDAKIWPPKSCHLDLGHDLGQDRAQDFF